MKKQNLKYLLSDLMCTHMKISNKPTLGDVAKIERLRMEIDEMLLMDLTIDRNFLVEIWQECFDRAKEEFNKETGKPFPQNEMGWSQVFEHEVHF